MRSIIHELMARNSSIKRSLLTFRDSIEKFEIWSPKDDVDFVFLCGANRGPGKPSRRREAILKFAKRNLPSTQFFLAENIFETLQKEGHNRNILDVESDLFAFSDYIIIILESESAFCELGAFTTQKEARSKIIIINDIQHNDSSSFINIGPIKAVQESSSSLNLLYYKMEKNGREQGDAIGSIFSDLQKMLHRKPRERRRRALNINPTYDLTKSTIRFLHDLIYFTGPIGFKEIDLILKILFRNSNHSKLRSHLGILRAIDQILYNDENHLYMSCTNRPYYHYSIDMDAVIASFRNTYYRRSPERLK